MVFMQAVPLAEQLPGQVSETTRVLFYVGYLGVAVTLVVWLARTLYGSGQVFLRDVFANEDLAKAVNKLLVIGFYLLNLGYAFLINQLGVGGQTLTVSFNSLVRSLATLLLSLGVIHLLNMFVFWRISTHRERRQRPVAASIANLVPNPQGQPYPQGQAPAGFAPQAYQAPPGAGAPYGPTR